MGHAKDKDYSVELVVIILCYRFVSFLTGWIPQLDVVQLLIDIDIKFKMVQSNRAELGLPVYVFIINELFNQRCLSNFSIANQANINCLLTVQTTSSCVWRLLYCWACFNLAGDASVRLCDIKKVFNAFIASRFSKIVWLRIPRLLH